MPAAFCFRGPRAQAAFVSQIAYRIDITFFLHKRRAANNAQNSSAILPADRSAVNSVQDAVFAVSSSKEHTKWARHGPWALRTDVNSAHNGSAAQETHAHSAQSGPEA